MNSRVFLSKNCVSFLRHFLSIFILWFYWCGMPYQQKVFGRRMPYLLHLCLRHWNSVFINVQPNMAAGTRRINMGLRFTHSPQLGNPVPTSNLVCIKEVAIRTNFCIAGIIYYTCYLVNDIQCAPYHNAFNKRSSRIVYQNNSAKFYSEKILTVCNAVYFRLCIHLIHLNPFPNKPWFSRVCSTSLLKTRWEKKKLLVTSNFFFSHSVFYPFIEISAILIKSEIVVCKLFQFGPV